MALWADYSAILEPIGGLDQLVCVPEEETELRPLSFSPPPPQPLSLSAVVGGLPLHRARMVMSPQVPSYESTEGRPSQNKTLFLYCFLRHLSQFYKGDQGRCLWPRRDSRKLVAHAEIANM